MNLGARFRQTEQRLMNRLYRLFVRQFDEACEARGKDLTEIPIIRKETRWAVPTLMNISLPSLATTWT